VIGVLSDRKSLEVENIDVNVNEQPVEVISPFKRARHDSIKVVTHLLKRLGSKAEMVDDRLFWFSDVVVRKTSGARSWPGPYAPALVGAPIIVNGRMVIVCVMTLRTLGSCSNFHMRTL